MTVYFGPQALPHPFTRRAQIFPGDAGMVVKALNAFEYQCGRCEHRRNWPATWADWLTPGA